MVSVLSATLRHFRPFKAPFPFPLAFDTYAYQTENESQARMGTRPMKGTTDCGSRTELYIQLSLRQAKSDILRLLPLFAQNLNWAV